MIPRPTLDSEEVTMDAVSKINGICKKVLSITDEEFAEMEEVAQNQLDYNHPMKMATAGWQRRLGEHNMAVLKGLRDLRETIRKGADIHRP